MKITKKQIVSAILLTALLLYTVIVVLPRGENYKGDNPMMKEGDIPILIAHGGGNREFPDNTLEAFYNAYSVDKRVMMETDVSITKDGVVILSHDTTLDRKTNVTGNISDWNYADLISERVDFGYTNPTENQKLSGERVKFHTDDGREVTPLDVEYPEGVSARDSEVFLATTLEELIIAFPENRINVEIKQEGELGRAALGEIINILDRHDAYDRVVLASFHPEMYEEFKKLQREGEVPEGFMYSPATSGVIEYYLLLTLGLDVFFNDGMCVFQLPTDEYGINLAKAGIVSGAHRHNLAVHYWTIDDKETMHNLIEIGADGIMTNYPHRLAEAYADYEAEKGK
ncbi:MAG: hypothetical protein IKD45_05485 [Clostridia bacterium]|nr:hypothetical protein [Clostridia bacterium]